MNYFAIKIERKSKTEHKYIYIYTCLRMNFIIKKCATIDKMCLVVKALSA